MVSHDMNSSTGQGDASPAPESGPPTGPAIREIPDARARIRAGRAAVGGRIAVLDDDPTGSQSVYGVSVVTVLEAAEYEAALTEPGSTCFILTNTRSLDQDDAVALNTEAGRALFELERRLSAPLDIISRSDSTLRGHVVAEVRALDKVRREVLGRGFDGVLLVPSFFEAGRFTAGDIHWAMVDGKPEPVGKTEFARDATFGYASSDLKDFISEKSAGTITAGNVLSLGLDDIRTGGVDRVAEILRSASDLQFIAVNATEYADLEIVVLGLAEVQKEGKRYLYRTGPSFVRALAGLDPRPPLRGADIWPEGRPGGHGLVVVGSHVGQTARQLAAVQARGGATEIELSVADLLEDGTGGDYVGGTMAKVIGALAGSDVVLYTSRSLRKGTDAAGSLKIARTISTAVTDIVRGALAARPAWVIAKGGITSHDVAVRGLGIRRATVLGQLFPGMVSVLRPIVAAEGMAGVPYVVFAGNVGDENALADSIDVFRGVKESAVRAENGGLS